MITSLNAKIVLILFERIITTGEHKEIKRYNLKVHWSEAIDKYFIYNRQPVQDFPKYTSVVYLSNRKIGKLIKNDLTLCKVLFDDKSYRVERVVVNPIVSHNTVELYLNEGSYQ